MGVCAIATRDSTNRSDGREGLKTGDPLIGLPAAADRPKGCTRSELRVQPSRNGGATGRAWLCHRSNFPLHFSERRKPQRRNDLIPRGAAPHFEMWHPSFQDVDPPLGPGASPPAARWIPSREDVAPVPLNCSMHNFSSRTPPSEGFIPKDGVARPLRAVRHPLMAHGDLHLTMGVGSQVHGCTTAQVQRWSGAQVNGCACHAIPSVFSGTGPADCALPPVTILRA